MTDQPICPSCGEPIDDDEQEELCWRSDLMDEALDGITDPGMELTLIAELAGEFLAKFPAEHRDVFRTLLIESIDEETASAAIALCDA